MINKTIYLSSYNGLIALLFFVISFSGLLISEPASAQIENLIVETYYVSDLNDATDTTQGRSLVAGMKTYRIYLDLAPGTRLRQIFGTAVHPLRISSTDVFYNNIDRPNANFGYQINKAWFNDNPTIGLDSWLTLGMTSTVYLGVPKSDDTDGSFVGGPNNSGGTAGVSGGVLVNADPLAGIPLTLADGYMPNTNVIGQWFETGFKNLSGSDTTVFGPVNIGNEFLSFNAVLQQNNGIMGADTLVNKILVAQLTTSGDLSFELNVELEQFDGTNFNIVSYVANGDSLLPGEVVSPSLTYPPSCGCTDPQYLEFSNAYACSLPDSCQTLIVFGCMDTLACNYDPNVNFNLPTLCCYPGYCTDRDLSLVCPSIANERFSIQQLYPLPAVNQLHVSCVSGTNEEISYFIYDALGKLVGEKFLGMSASGTFYIQIDISTLNSGLYFLIIRNGNITDKKTFIKDDSRN